MKEKEYKNLDYASKKEIKLLKKKKKFQNNNKIFLHKIIDFLKNNSVFQVSSKDL